MLHHKSHFHHLIGLAGVAEDEGDVARLWGHYLEWPMLLLALWIILEWYLGANGLSTPYISQLTDWVVWLFFIFETAVLFTLVDKKGRYLRENWLNLFIVLAGVPIIWGITLHLAGLRTLRLLIVLGLLFNMSKTVREILSRNNLGTTLMVGFVLIIMAGFIIAGIDPGIESPWQGIWWAWVTVTTVGYGDVVPTTVAGKMFGAILILLGIGLFSLLTASFSAFLISKSEDEISGKEDRTLKKLEQLEQKLERIEQQLRRGAGN